MRLGLGLGPEMFESSARGLQVKIEYSYSLSRRGHQDLLAKIHQGPSYIGGAPLNGLYLLQDIPDPRTEWPYRNILPTTFRSLPTIRHHLLPHLLPPQSFEKIQETPSRPLRRQRGTATLGLRQGSIVGVTLTPNCSIRGKVFKD